MLKDGSWHALSLGDALTAHLPLARIREAFDARFPPSARPAGAAVYTRQTLAGQLHCEVTVFFSPATGALAREFGAQPCAQPGRRGLELLAGDTGALDISG